MPTMTQKSNSSKLKHWVQTLSLPERNDLRERFQQHFSFSTDGPFYRTLNAETLPLDRALWFAEQLSIRVEDLTSYPWDNKD